MLGSTSWKCGNGPVLLASAVKITVLLGFTVVVFDGFAVVADVTFAGFAVVVVTLLGVDVAFTGFVVVVVALLGADVAFTGFTVVVVALLGTDVAFAGLAVVDGFVVVLLLGTDVAFVGFAVVVTADVVLLGADVVFAFKATFSSISGIAPPKTAPAIKSKVKVWAVDKKMFM